MRKLAFIAHPYGGDHANLDRVPARIVQVAEQLGFVPICTWPLWCRLWDEGKRELGIELNKRTIDRCDVFVMTGTHISEGMKQELKYAQSIGLEVVDLTEAP